MIGKSSHAASVAHKKPDFDFIPTSVVNAPYILGASKKLKEIGDYIAHKGSDAFRVASISYAKAGTEPDIMAMLSKQPIGGKIGAYLASEEELGKKSPKPKSKNKPFVFVQLCLPRQEHYEPDLLKFRDEMKALFPEKKLTMNFNDVTRHHPKGGDTRHTLCNFTVDSDPKLLLDWLKQKDPQGVHQVCKKAREIS